MTLPDRTSRPGVAAVVLCGGTSARMGGVDKTALDLGGRSVLDALVGALPDEWTVVCVGEERGLPRPVVWTREDPPQGGPVAGLAAGTAAAPMSADIVAALAGDQPFAGPAALRCVEVLCRSTDDVDGVAALQADGRLQPLLAAYRRLPLLRALATAPMGAGVYRTLSSLRVHGIEPGARAAFDVDTPADLDAARRLT